MDDNEKRKNEIISKLQTLYSCGVLKPHECEWILQTIDYIKELVNDQVRCRVIRVHTRVYGVYDYADNYESDNCIGDGE